VLDHVNLKRDPLFGSHRSRHLEIEDDMQPSSTQYTRYFRLFQGEISVHHRNFTVKVFGFTLFERTQMYHRQTK
jgi:hypothetical protein